MGRKKEDRNRIIRETPINLRCELLFDIPIKDIDKAGFDILKASVALRTNNLFNKGECFHYVCETCGRYVKEFMKGKRNDNIVSTPLKCCYGKNMKKMDTFYGQYEIPSTITGNKKSKIVTYKEKSGGEALAIATTLTKKDGVLKLQKWVKENFGFIDESKFFLKEIDVFNRKYKSRLMFSRTKVGKIIMDGRELTQWGLKLKKIDGKKLTAIKGNIPYLYTEGFRDEVCLEDGCMQLVFNPSCIMPV